ncbi:carboxypeptidase-like regulatory domain-containing protein [Winogradskyella echinorum]|uniref:Carboxypeptidase-like regulatory domain-containing protein n=1 Tax=Winogradskyella echinorum TaxID=538189 RepID=A0ABR6Y4U9_9FLAO|nr:carboxypeptidase-like regulatory domain-containing protein [Winogradskyella echinorum]MBC3847293.1 carboxypeptidase-like regulatory domain-containing protein [Winogradskyella echinorum]MBC5751641.1 carboxypeptidase-like regulatory domain-containing protein [Winogradskyella echinorum]
MRLFYLAIVFICLGTFISPSQERQQLLFRVINAETKKPVSYATIRFANSKSGTVANVLGDFRIPIRYKKENDTLVVSCIGYSTKRFVLSSLTEKSYHILILYPKTEQLSEVFLDTKKKKELTAKQIVKKAIESIKDNFPVEPFSYITYYRDYQFVDEKYINLNEGIAEVFDQGFLTHKISDPLNTTALYSYDLNTEFTRDTLISNSIYNDTKQIKDGKMGTSIGNELTLLNIHNPIRNYKSGSFSFVYIFEKDFVKNHKFYKKGAIFLDDEELYKIEFSAHTDLTGYAYKANGFIYISKEDFAIHRFDYKLYSELLKNSVFTVDLEYKRQENDKMYLNYITFNNNFFITENNALKIESYSYDKAKRSFIMSFNRALDVKSIEKTSNVKLSYKDEKLPTYRLNFITPTTVEVKFKKEVSDFLNAQNIADKALFSIKLKNFQDLLGFKMEKSKVKGYQFREMFIQRVFLNNPSNSNLKYVDKAKSLKEAFINDFNAEDYWLNSPLKTTDN